MDRKFKLFNIKEMKLKIIIALIIIIFIIIMRITNSTQLALGPIEGIVKETFIPVQSLSNSACNNFVNFFKGLLNYKKIKDENNFIKEKIAKIEAENQILNEYKIENEKLRNSLDIKKTNEELAIVTAEVVGRSIKYWYKTVSINKGINHKIKINMPAITYRGFIGRVTSVTNNTSEITLISDPKYGAVSALAKESRYPGIVIGSEDGSGSVKMIQIPAEAPIQEGFDIITSGLGDMIYKNLKIGKVKSIKNASDGLMKEAIIEPYENLKDLNFIMIILN